MHVQYLLGHARNIVEDVRKTRLGRAGGPGDDHARGGRPERFTT